MQDIAPIDLELIDIAEAAYTDWQIEVGDSFIRIDRTKDGTLVIGARGTKMEDLRDDLADLDSAFANHPILGTVHHGFLTNALAMVDQVEAIVRAEPDLRWIATGHSKGAAEICLIVALLIVRGLPPIRMTTFGMPACGFHQLSTLVWPVHGSDYRNGIDPVTRVPLLFQHPRPLVRLGRPEFKINPIEDHYLASYRASLAVALTGAIAA
jgi:hypothetical protein